MTSERKQQVKRGFWTGGKFLAALGALTAALNGYNRLLEKQEDVLFIMSTKINALTEKVAYLEGRIAGHSPERSAREVRSRVQPLSKVMDEPQSETVEQLEKSDTTGAGKKFKAKALPKLFHPPAPIQDLAYQEVPVQMKDIERFKEQLKKSPAGR